MFKTSDLEVVFNGKLGLDFINTKDHPPMNFTTEGWLSIGRTKKWISGNGELHHIENSSTFACMLSITMSLDLEELEIRPPPGVENKFNAIIRQTLLQYDNN